MQTNSQNLTVEDLDTCLRFVFRHKYTGFYLVKFVLTNVLSIVVWLLLCVFFLLNIQRWFQYMQIENDLNFILLYALSLLAAFPKAVKNFLDIFWGLNGKEIVEISSAGIVVRHQALIFETSKTFEAERIPCLFVSRQDPARFQYFYEEVRFYNFSRGRIAFNGEKKMFGRVITCRFGSILKPAEARQVIAIIHKRFPQYKCAAKSTGG